MMELYGVDYRDIAIVVLLLVLVISHGSRNYWKGKAGDEGYDDEYEWHRERIEEWNAWARGMANHAAERRIDRQDEE